LKKLSEQYAQDMKRQQEQIEILQQQVQKLAEQQRILINALNEV
jgi:polyhydroxyalkanoate synthesis regulator phasin